jgi:hypothetical protein
VTATKDIPITFGITRKSLEGVLIHACPHCNAPGVYKCDQHTLQQWPGCWAPERPFRLGGPAHNQPVGDYCPNCHKRRIKDLNMGELTSSMPFWIWRSILAIKWCVIKVLTLKQRIGERYG